MLAAGALLTATAARRALSGAVRVAAEAVRDFGRIRVTRARIRGPH
jgi:hypothetical protein